MSMEQPISGLKKAERIPQGTTYVSSMGDGSGTALVSQELLEEEVKEKVSVDVLDTKEEIEANTEEGKAAGALAVKEMVSELNDNLSELSAKTKAYTYTGAVGNDGYIIVPHNLNIQSYTPLIQLSGPHAFISYGIRDITKNSFKIGIMIADNYVLTQAAGQTITVYYMLV